MSVSLPEEPGLFSRLGELRVFLELGSIVPSLPALMHAPRGDGHPVLVLPGVLTSDGSTVVLRRYLQALGHSVHPWKLGLNWGPSSEVRDGVRKRLEELSNRYQRRVSIVGWSLGGIFAREIAREQPTLIRQIITLASPFSAGYRMDGSFDPELGKRMRKAPPVPCTAIYSKSDGVVPWESCREDEGPETDNIEVQATHLGMSVNPLVLWAIADRLALPEGKWRPFDRTGFHSFFY